MTTLITGAAGFIGSALAESLLLDGEEVIGVDNHNDYYDLALKEARTQRLLKHANYKHVREDIANSDALDKIFEDVRPSCVVNLAAQAGVRYSLEAPRAYAQSNIVGFINVLEACRNVGIDHLVYASSSSVYGANRSMPFSTSDNVDHPLNLYAATKKSNELLAHSYSHLFDMPTTGLRFFTVYGPWGRPDMAPYKFVRAALEGTPINVYNHGDHLRDFTYIDDIVQGIRLVMKRPATGDATWSGLDPNPSTSLAPWRTYNIGSETPVGLMEFISSIEESTGSVIEKNFLPMQAGDMQATFADVSPLRHDFGYEPTVPVSKGVSTLVEWYRSYHRL